MTAVTTASDLRQHSFCTREVIQERKDTSRFLIPAAVLSGRADARALEEWSLPGGRRCQGTALDRGAGGLQGAGSEPAGGSAVLLPVGLRHKMQIPGPAPDPLTACEGGPGVSAIHTAHMRGFHAYEVWKTPRVWAAMFDL